MPKHLVIVESPAKAKTIGRYLGDDFIVESSVGHIRDIPTKVGEVSEAKKKEWKETRFGVDIDNGFKPMYVVTPEFEEAGCSAPQGAQGCRLPVPRNRRGSRGRSNRVASPRSSEAEDSRPPDGVSRDHLGGHTGGSRPSA